MPYFSFTISLKIHILPYFCHQMAKIAVWKYVGFLHIVLPGGPADVALLSSPSHCMITITSTNIATVTSDQST